MNTASSRTLGFILALGLFASPAAAQLHVKALAGLTSAANQQPFFAGSLGVKVVLIEIDLEAGRMKDVVPKGVLDQLNRLQRERGLPVQAIASVPVSYALANVRVISPAGIVKPFLSGGLGVARLEPRFDVVVNGISLGDVFGLTQFNTQNKTMLAVAAGLRFDVSKLLLEGGYRYVRIYTDFSADSNLTNDRLLTDLHCLYVGLGVRF